MGSHGRRVDFDAAHSQATRFNELARLGGVGAVFHACCPLETTTNAFHIRMLPNSPTGYGSVSGGAPSPGGRDRPGVTAARHRRQQQDLRPARGFSSTSRAFLVRSPTDSPARNRFPDGGPNAATPWGCPLGSSSPLRRARRAGPVQLKWRRLSRQARPLGLLPPSAELPLVDAFDLRRSAYRA
jgi:hypothetical protein